MWCMFLVEHGPVHDSAPVIHCEGEVSKTRQLNAVGYTFT